MDGGDSVTRRVAEAHGDLTPKEGREGEEEDTTVARLQEG